MGHELQRLSHVHLSMVDHALAGWNQKEIAAAYGMTTAAIGLILKSPLFQDALARRRAEQQKTLDSGQVDNLQLAKNILDVNAPRAAMVLNEQLDASDQKLRQTAAVEILNRTTGKGPVEQGSTGAVLQLAGTAMQALMLALSESNADRAQRGLGPGTGIQVQGSVVEQVSGSAPADGTQRDLEQASATEAA